MSSPSAAKLVIVGPNYDQTFVYLYSAAHFERGEKLAVGLIATDGTLKLTHEELDMDSFRMLVGKEYSSIAQIHVDVQFLKQCLNSCLCEFRFSTMTTIKIKSENDCLLRTNYNGGVSLRLVRKLNCCAEAIRHTF